MSVIQLKPEPERERKPGPYEADRHCACGTKLSRYNPSESCAPCSGGDWVSPIQLYTDRQVRADRADLLKELIGDGAIGELAA
jgi:hypothetical protein